MLNVVAGRGGEQFSARIHQILGNLYSSSNQPHFENVSQLIDFVSNHSENLRGLPHGYCTRGPDCEVKNVVDPSHCIYCDGYIVTPKHLPHWKVIKASCEQKIKVIKLAPETIQKRMKAFKVALANNLNAAEMMIGKLTNSTLEKEFCHE